MKVALIVRIEFKWIRPYLDGLIIRASNELTVGQGYHGTNTANMALKTAYILESSHVEHVHWTVIRTSHQLTLRQLQHNVHRSRMVLLSLKTTEEKEADFAIFLTPAGGIFANWSIIALGLLYLLFVIFEDELLCKLINKGPACDNLFSKTLKYDLILSNRL